MLTPLPDKLEIPQGSSRNLWFFAVLILIVLFLGLIMQSFLNKPKLLTDPFLQLPTTNSVRVVWFTEFSGTRNIVAYGENLSKIATANTTKLSRVREDKDSHISDEMKQGIIDNNPIVRHIWRHEAEITNLMPGVRIPYLVTSETKDGESVSSKVFSLSPTPAAGIGLKILFTSDHQLMPMTAANLQKVAQTIDKVDAVFMAGDLINIADRASEWFDDDRGRAFFPGLQGRAFSEIDKNGIKTVYSGGELIQHAPIFPTIGNHEIMGRFSTSSSLNDQFNDPFPRAAVEKIYPYLTQKYGMKDQDVLLKNNSFNSDTYNEIFSLPSEKNYYAVTFGDVRLVTLYVTNIWRTPNLDPGARGRYRERDEDFDRPEKWGYGQHIFEPIAKGSAQYSWLEQELYSAEFQQAKYKIVMFHHPPHSLGDNIVPAYTDPVQIVDRTLDGEIKMVRYEYPKQQDYLIRDVMPLLETAGVQLVLYGHSHLWNRFVSSSGMHFLETSNVGNSYGAFAGRKRRFVPPGYGEDYSAIGDPNGLEPVMPTVAPLLGKDGLALPYIDSNDITAFSIFDTGNATVSSYYFDTRKPDSEVVKFDEFKLKKS
ncbi:MULTISPECIES: metallophosphoesterase family protein [unclassified Microcoleus]|uniref:metallophosphoesterase family protein n=1 Tax=unclassified Microcoleus TaxID=2642155 RepID=UPI001D20DCB0|nr:MULTISPECIES: metallophosphoesterase family protein [unclassified Microcoleus]TAF95504.1 MAG: metallophosphoesterase family protein [Oscillatoriales cyanobacterium]MCC3437993.1 metallophosphoesterase family protein [Microcoleus sp. PH2017_05_CCC_O_A]MCC3474613.1 metallophosphoesterase family protein [Microcoleus sp. PH2017_13_LAR_U_A]MCC3487113.1 metallophosphoesterase family protein [Microcoleus sp. PH2017_14_LAR_D_A]MCC3593261.1 metallophosphoesterase family protein [Microcoleus sp. PH201